MEITKEMARAGIFDRALKIAKRIGWVKAGVAERAKEVFEQAEQVLKAAGEDVEIGGRGINDDCGRSSEDRDV